MAALAITIPVNPVHGTERTGVRPDNDNYTIAPYQSISAALAAARVGDTVHVMKGTYAETITLRNGIDLYFDYGAIVDVATGNGRIPINDGTASVNSAVTCKVLGYGSFRRGGAPTGGDNPVISLYNTASNVYIEGSTFENYCSTANETEVFRTAGGAILKIKQTAAGVVKALTYDLFVTYQSTGEITGEFLDLVESAQALLEAGAGVETAQMRFRLKAKRGLSHGAVGGGNSAIDIFAPGAGCDVGIELSEELRITGAFPAIAYRDVLGKFYIKCPLIVSEGDTAIEAEFNESFIVDGPTSIVSGGSNKPAVKCGATSLVLANCRLFPSGSAKSITGAGTVQSLASFATENADTGAGVTILGTLTKVAITNPEA